LKAEAYAYDFKGITITTTITFENSELAVTLVFCGDQQSLFPLNTNVRAEYTAGVLCSVLTKVVIIIESRNP
jgi:hypothetical protein